MNKYLTEGIGSFFLFLTLVLTSGGQPYAPLATGAVLMAMMYAGGHVSGGHYNPAVTLAVLMRGKVDRTDALYYVIAQAAGAVLAAIFGIFLANCAGMNAIVTHANKNGLCSLMAEFFGAFALTYTFLNVATTRSNAGNSHYGLAVGLMLAGAIWTFGGVSGGIFNPAAALCAAISGMLEWGDLWLYMIGSLMGAAAAASAFQIVYGRQD